MWLPTTVITVFQCILNISSKKKITFQMRIGPGLPQQNQRVNNSSTTKTQEHSGSVVECLTRDRKAAGLTLTGVTVLWTWARHIYPCLVLVQPRTAPPDITEKLLTGTLRIKSNKTTKKLLQRAFSNFVTGLESNWTWQFMWLSAGRWYTWNVNHIYSQNLRKILQKIVMIDISTIWLLGTFIWFKKYNEK